MGNKLTKMAKELLQIEDDLPFRFDYSKGDSPEIDDFDLYTFEQVWGSTALGFGGMGGQVTTAANTYVFVPLGCNQYCFVYFGGRFAYSAPYCESLRLDIRRQKMAPVSGRGKYAQQKGVE